MNSFVCSRLFLRSSLGALALTAALAANGQSITGVHLNPSSVFGGSASTGTVILSTPAGANGATVTLLSQYASLVGVPATVKVAAGYKTAAFNITTVQHPSTFTDVITGKLNGSSASETLTILDDSIAKLDIPTGLRGGAVANGTVTLKIAAPVHGWKVSFTSSDTSKVTLPSSVTVPEGQTSAKFAISTKPFTQNYKVNITATDATSSIGLPLSVIDDSVYGVSLSPSTTPGGSTSTGTVRLLQAAPAGGWTVKLGSQKPSYVSVPSELTVPEGATTATFTASTKYYASQYTNTITASDSGSSKTATLTVSIGPKFVQVPVGVRDIAYDWVHDLLLIAPKADDGTLLVFNPATGAKVRTITLNAGVGLVTMSGDGNNILLGCDDGNIRVLRGSTYQLIDTIQVPDGHTAVSITALPKTAESFAVANDPWTYVFDGQIERPNHASFGITQAISADGTHFFGADARYSGNAYAVCKINSLGLADVVVGYGPGSYDLADQDGYPVCGDGTVLDPNTAQKLYSLPFTASSNRNVTSIPGTHQLVDLFWDPKTAEIIDFPSRKKVASILLPQTDGGLQKVVSAGNHRFAYFTFGFISDYQFVIVTTPALALEKH